MVSCELRSYYLSLPSIPRWRNDLLSFSGYSAGIWKLETKQTKGGLRVVFFSCYVKTNQKGLAASSVYARESWHREWRRYLAVKDTVELLVDFPNYREEESLVGKCNEVKLSFQLNHLWWRIHSNFRLWKLWITVDICLINILVLTHKNTNNTHMSTLIKKVCRWVITASKELSSRHGQCSKYCSSRLCIWVSFSVENNPLHTSQCPIHVREQGEVKLGLRRWSNSVLFPFLFTDWLNKL